MWIWEYTNSPWSFRKWGLKPEPVLVRWSALFAENRSRHVQPKQNTVLLNARIERPTWNEQMVFIEYFFISSVRWTAWSVVILLLTLSWSRFLKFLRWLIGSSSCMKDEPADSGRINPLKTRTRLVKSQSPGRVLLINWRKSKQPPTNLPLLAFTREPKAVTIVW